MAAPFIPPRTPDAIKLPTQAQPDPAETRHREIIERLDRLIELAELQARLLGWKPPKARGWE